MSSVVISGDVSGSVTLQAPSAAGTTVLTLPATSGTVITGAGGVTGTSAGGTGLSSFTSGGAMYATSTSALTTGTLPVASGGTGATSATAYAVQCGGTTSTGAHQSVASLGTSGQVLTSQGASALPTWTTISSTPTTQQVLDATAGASAGAVGTYGLFFITFGLGSFNFNSTIAGSNLTPSNAGGTTNGNQPSGTWRSMGYANSNDTAPRATTVFLRVS
jgi:hypothetical protein